MPLASTGVHSRPPPPRSSSGFRAARSFVYLGNPRRLRVPHLLNGDNLVGVLVSGLVNRGELGTEARMSQSMLSACWHSPVPGGLRPTPPEDKPKGGRPPGPTKGRAGVGGHGEPRQDAGRRCGGHTGEPRQGVGDTPGTPPGCGVRGCEGPCLDPNPNPTASPGPPRENPASHSASLET